MLNGTSELWLPSAACSPLPRARPRLCPRPRDRPRPRPRPGVSSMFFLLVSGVTGNNSLEPVAQKDGEALGALGGGVVKGADPPAAWSRRANTKAWTSICAFINCKLRLDEPPPKPKVCYRMKLMTMKKTKNLSLT